MDIKNNQVAVKEERGLTEYVPFGANDKIKLSVAIVKNLVCVPTKSGVICSDRDAIRFIAMCQARKLNPFEGDAFLIGYDGRDGPTFSLITAHQAFLKRAELNPEYNGMESGLIVEQDGVIKDIKGDFYIKGQNALGGWATVHFKSRQFPMEKRIRLERFRKGFGVWLDDPAGMIVKCAEADALRSAFPTMLGGLYLKEELEPRAALASAPLFSGEKKAEVTMDPPSEVKVSSVPLDNPYVSDILKRVAALGSTEQQVIDALTELGVIDTGMKSLDEISIQNPETFEMLERNLENIIERSKTK